MFNFFRKKEPQTTTLSSISNIGGLIKEGGDFLSDELILLDDKLTANLFCSDRIEIEQGGHLTGNVCGNICVISGTVIGNVSSTELLEIKKTAIVKGRVKAASISIEPGAVINGPVTIGEEKAMVVSLYQKIHKHTEEEYLSARWAYEQTQGNAVDLAADTTGAEPVNTHPTLKAEQPKAPVADVQSKKVKTEDTPAAIAAAEPQAAIIAKEEIKPEPTPQRQNELVVKESPKKEQKPTPPKEDNIQRWW